MSKREVVFRLVWPKDFVRELPPLVCEDENSQFWRNMLEDVAQVPSPVEVMTPVTKKPRVEEEDNALLTHAKLTFQ